MSAAERPSLSTSRSRFSALSGLIVLAACATPPAPRPTAPDAASVLRHRSGTLTSTRMPDPDYLERVTEASAFHVRCTFRFVPRALAEFQGEPLAPDTRLLVARRVADALIGASRLAAGARYGTGEPPTLTGETPIAELNTALPAGVTATFALRERASIDGELDPPLAVFVSRETTDATGPLQLAIGLHGQDPDSDKERIELLILSPELAVDATPIWIVLPSPFDGTDADARGAIVIRLEANTPVPDDAKHRLALAACLDDLRRLHEADATAALRLSDADALARSQAVALRTLEQPFDLRRSLAFLAESARAETMLDLVLACDETSLAELARLIRSAPAFSQDPDRPATETTTPPDWALDSIAWRFLAERLDAGRLDDAQRGFLLRRAGAPGRFPGTLAAMLDTAHSSKDFDAALTAENRVVLTTSDPSTCLSAYDWLAARGVAPAGYDPLASRQARREALERAEAAK